MSTMKAQYSSCLLHAINSDFHTCSISMSPGPSKTIPTLIPFMFEEPLIDNVHYEGAYTSIGELSSAKTISHSLRLNASS